MKERYIGKELWEYWINGNTSKGCDGQIILKLPTGNYKEDEAMARYDIRKKLNIKRLPKGFYVTPSKTRV